MPSVSDLLEANIRRVFGNRDAEARRIAIDEIYAADVAFTDPEGTVVGRDALEARAAALLDSAPADFAFVEIGLPYADRETGALAWEFGPRGAPVAHGIDIIRVADGRIRSLQTLLTPTVDADR